MKSQSWQSLGLHLLAVEPEEDKRSFSWQLLATSPCWMCTTVFSQRNKIQYILCSYDNVWRAIAYQEKLNIQRIFFRNGIHIRTVLDANWTLANSLIRDQIVKGGQAKQLRMLLSKETDLTSQLTLASEVVWGTTRSEHDDRLRNVMAGKSELKLN